MMHTSQRAALEGESPSRVGNASKYVALKLAAVSFGNGRYFFAHSGFRAARQRRIETVGLAVIVHHKPALLADRDGPGLPHRPGNLAFAQRVLAHRGIGGS